MKKFLAIFLTVMVLLSTTTMFVSAGASFDNDISCLDYLDFSAENNKWNERDAEGNLINTSFGDDDLVNGHYPFAILLEDRGYSDYLSYEFTNDGEAIKMSSIDQDNNAGLAFRLSTINKYLAGSETSGGTEYIKIRIKNSSPSTKMTFIGGMSNWGSGKIDSRIRGTLDIESNSSEWKTYTFSMRDLNFDTVGSYYWATYLREFAIFPFGYSSDNEAIEGEQYYMEIDYVVIGSLEYVTNYESALEVKENSATGFEAITLPTKQTYYMGDRLDLTGLSAKITFNADPNNTEIVDTASAIYDFEKPEGLGDEVTSWKTKVKLVYGSHSIDYEVTVVDIASIEFETEQETDVYNKIELLQAGEFTPVGMTLRVNYADGTYKVKELYEITLEGADVKTDFTKDTQLSEEGYYTYIVTAKFYGHSITFPVNLIDIKEIVLTPIEDKKNNVYYGTAIGTDFFDVTCVYTDGSKVALADSGLADYFSVACDTNIAGGDAVAKAAIYNEAYDIDISTDVNVTVQTPTSMTVKLSQADRVYVDSTIDISKFTVTYTYADGATAAIAKDDPNLIIRYDTSVTGANKGTVKIGGMTQTFDYSVMDAKFDADALTLKEQLANRGTVKLLSPKFPTFWLVTIIIAVVLVLLVGAFCLLKFVFKVEFKRKKRVSLDDIF